MVLELYFTKPCVSIATDLDVLPPCNFTSEYAHPHALPEYQAHNEVCGCAVGRVCGCAVGRVCGCGCEEGVWVCSEEGVCSIVEKGVVFLGEVNYCVSR